MKLTENFSKAEFDSKDGSQMPDDVLENVKLLAEQLQFLRDYLQKPIHINSGYRSPSHNTAIGGSKTSQHLKGKAADIVINGMLPIEVYHLIAMLIDDGEISEGGLGLYNTFVHYDIRGNRARWELIS